MAKHTLSLALKRAYDEPEASDGTRVLLSRLWPRGLSKESGPSNQLRQWFHHDPEKFVEFGRRYETQLQSPTGQQALAQLRDMAKQGKVTLLFAARDGEHCHALVLRDLLLQSS